MKNAKFLLVLFATAVLAACDSGDDGSSKKPGDFGTIQVPDVGQLTQTTYADQTQPASGVTFSTAGAWTSDITNVSRAEAPDWLSISPDHGNAAGSYTIQITLTPNDTGADRVARIVIACDGNTITITITQTAGKEPEPDVPEKPVAQMQIAYIDTFFQSEQSPQDGRRWIGREYFEYDKQGRLTTFNYDDTPENTTNPFETSVIFTYPSATTVRIEEIDPEIKTATNAVGRFGKTETSRAASLVCNVTLDTKGRAIEVRREGISDRLTFAYDADGFCTECRPYDISIPGSAGFSKVSYGWTDGNLTSIDTYDKNGTKDPSYSSGSYLYTTQDNDKRDVNIDLNAKLFSMCPRVPFETQADITSALAAFDFLGERSRKLTTSSYIDEDRPVSIDPDFRYYYEVSSDIKWGDNPVRLVEEVMNYRYIKESLTTGQKELVRTYNEIYRYEIHHVK